MSVINLRSGYVLDILNPDPDYIFIEDIAWALAYTCRFGGHCSEFYSVAQHSVYASKVVPSSHMLAALLHDAAEAYIGDVVGPLKKLLPDYMIIEKRIETAIAERFDLWGITSDEIKCADMRLLRTEQRDLIKGYSPAWNRAHEPFDFKVTPQPPNLAAIMFLHRYEQLGGHYA